MRKLYLIVGLVSVVAIYVLATSKNDLFAMDSHDHNGMMVAQTQNAPLEPGQGGFAAIAEIVTLLNNDPQTDWEEVNIGALREHLVDMNELTLNADVKSAISDDKIQFFVSGKGRTIRAIKNMVPAHAKQLASSLNWDTATEQTADGVVLTISSNDSIQIKKLAALGFFGVMATGAHHQSHHFQMAKGNSHIH